MAGALLVLLLLLEQAAQMQELSFCFQHALCWTPGVQMKVFPWFTVGKLSDALTYHQGGGGLKASCDISLGLLC